MKIKRFKWWFIDLWAWAVQVWWTIHNKIGGVICRFRPHKMVKDDAWAGPDSGGFSVHCTRCGYSHTTNLY